MKLDKAAEAFSAESAKRFLNLANLSGPAQWIPFPVGSVAHVGMNCSGHDLYVDESEFHSRRVTLSDGNTYSVELEMTLEHR
jgi:hypothetical protein